MEKFETYLCPLCYSKHTGKCSKIEWTSSLSPKQEWRLHNGEGDVPEWFIRWSERVYTAAVSNREKEIAEEVKKNEKLPYEPRYCQSRNGIYYCGTCEQAWEMCSCSARNTGYKRAIDEVIKILKH